MLYLTAATQTLRRRLTPLALRLAAFACVLAVPIVWLASLQKARLDAAVSVWAAEAISIRWILMADELTGHEYDVSVPGAGEAARGKLRLRIAELRAFAVRNALAMPAAPVATARIEDAWNVLFDGPSPAALANVTNTTYRAIAAVSESSQLSFESDYVLADLGDALDNTYFSVFAPLESAAGATQLGWRAGHLSLDDRILIAGLVAQTRGAELPLGSDMSNALEHQPSLRVTLGSEYGAALKAVSSLYASVQDAVRSERGSGDARLLGTQRDALAAPTSVLLNMLSTESLERIRVLASDAQRNERRLYYQNAFAVVLDFSGVLFAGRLIARRYRRDIERAKEQARMLSVELAREQAEHARMLTDAQFRAVFDRSQMGIALLDRSGETTECNPALSKSLGNTTPRIVPAADARFAKLIAGAEPTYQYEGPLVGRDGNVRWSEITVSSIDVPQSEALAAIAIVQDITERKAIDERLRFQAAHDDLTLLPNRTQFLSRLDDILAKGVDLGRYAVLFVDLDKFKLVNDTLGHSAGDRVIGIAAQRLVATTRSGDIVARLHGDEFAVVVSDAGKRVPGELVAERIKKTFLAPITIDGTAVVLTASVGIVPGLAGYEAAENVLRDADVAMYNAKKLGRSTAVTFDHDMHARLSKHMRMLTEIALAIDREEFRLVYQPIVDLASGTIAGVEALMRWHHPTLGVVSPIDFIPVAEETDAIEYLGRLALRETCAMLARMDAAGMTKITASVNLSVPHLSNGEVIADVRNVLEASRIRAPRLMLEITESALLENGTRAANVLNELSALGVRLCIDDFGTGYSSLRYLHEYPISALKIDRSFIYAPSGGIANGPIVHMLLTLARSLNLSVIAEGIETETQREVLIAEGCTLAQGYLFSRPLDEASLMRWIATCSAENDLASVTVA